MSFFHKNLRGGVFAGKTQWSVILAAVLEGALFGFCQRKPRALHDAQTADSGCGCGKRCGDEKDSGNDAAVRFEDGGIRSN